MAQTIEIVAEVRDRAGKGAARAARRADKVPAVLYGNKQPPVMIALELRRVNRLLRDPSYPTYLYSIEINGKRQQALLRDVQRDPVRDTPLHMDFLRASARTEIDVNVPVQFIGEDKSPGLKIGGVLNVVRHEIEVTCRAGDIPDFIEVDLSAAELNDTIHISQVTLPKGVTPTIDRDFTIATIAAPSALRSGAEEEEEEETEEEATEE